MLPLPQEFELLGTTWKVKKKRGLQHGDDACYGLTDKDKSVVWLDAATLKDKDKAAHTALHELIHCIASAMNWPELDADESRVDVLAGMLLQAWKTKKGELK